MKFSAPLEKLTPFHTTTFPIQNQKFSEPPQHVFFPNILDPSSLFPKGVHIMKNIVYELSQEWLNNSGREQLILGRFQYWVKTKPGAQSSCHK